jgi:replicative DNA helicase
MGELIKEKFCQPGDERALISFSLNSIENYFNISSSVSAEDFLRPEHKLIWVILDTLAKNNVSKFDVAMIIHEAQSNGVLKGIGGYDYVTSLAGMEVSGENLKYYIDRVLDASTKYQLYTQLNHNLKQIGDNAADTTVGAADVIGTVSRDVMALSLKSKAVKEATNLSDGLKEYIEERKNNPIEFCGLSSGYSILDKRIDGLVPGTLTVLCARPKHGKSAFLSNVGAFVALESMKPVLYVDTEMPFEQWRSRIVAKMTNVPERRIKHGGYSEQEYYNIQQALTLIEKGKFFHEYMPGYSLDKLNALYKKYKYIENIELAIFDYIKEPASSLKDRKEHQLLGDVTTTLKDLAGELQIPFLCATQINRQQDIADSDRILRYADVLMVFKTRSAEEMAATGAEGGTHKLIITDSRRGGTTPVDGIGYKFLKSMLQISEAKIQMIDYDSKEYREKEDMEYELGDSEEPKQSSENF